MSAINVNTAAGPDKPEGFYAIDLRQSEFVDVQFDVEKSLPFSSNSIDTLRASQVLEHLLVPFDIRMLIVLKTIE